ncbi:hypothetical protein OH76DRAFT_1344188 [Lentinus brumalis]|uniref:Protein kinase domain-containing protein n=1 Tax=Lentinus brumalis TaxID=2498619 RepID=A0A371DKD8_9APHY|nr:hypothetical protein OH76DRAFT_1344188 [Polyporus brumalis]
MSSSTSRRRRCSGEHQSFLYSRRYTLRPRYRPGWVPSWRQDSTIRLLDAEDRLSFWSHLMDARRLTDGMLELIKKVRTDSRELQIATFLSSATLRRDPRDHCVPILEVLRDPEDPAISLLVMPFLRYVDDPAFDCVGIILDCVEQLLEGLVFLHEHNVAHRDCAYKNIMVDPTSMYPLGFHPIANRCLPDGNNFAEVIPRSVVSVTYYYIDFGISSMFASDDARFLVTGMSGLDRDVPELSDDVPYDPFKVDIFILGNFFRETFTDKFSNVGMLTPLVRRMLTTDPNGRPSAAEALAHFRVVRRNARTVHRIWRLWSRNEALVIRPIVDMWWVVSSGRGYRSRCALLTPSWPSTTGLSPARPCLGLDITGIRDRTRIGFRFLAICAQYAPLISVFYFRDDVP